jgi:hypothetical protein
MKEVWFVESGEYSDYTVVGVFSTEENANMIRDLLNATVVKRVLDPGVNELREGMSQFYVQMLKDGTVEKCVLQTEISAYTFEDQPRIWRRSIAPAYKNTGVQDCLQGTFWAKDSTHAVKIANEYRAQFIASGEWDRKDKD